MAQSSAEVVTDNPLGNKKGALVRSKGTLEFELRPHRISAEKLRELHGPVLGMITKILGELFMLQASRGLVFLRGLTVTRITPNFCEPAYELTFLESVLSYSRHRG